MAKQYLTYNYLQKLLQFIVQEHLELKYGGELTKAHLAEGRALYERAAETLWENIEIKKPKKRGGQNKDEFERTKLVIHLIENQGLKPNAAYRMVAELFPVSGVSLESLIQRLRRSHQKKRSKKERDEMLSPIFIFQAENSLEVDTSALEKDAAGYFRNVTMKDLIQRIENKLCRD